jgi:hypothetical protein
MLNIKALAMATAVSAGVVFAMPVISEAMPVTSPVKIQTAGDSNIVTVKNKKKKWDNWWARHCAISNDVKCRRTYTGHYRYRTYDEPYYGYYRPYRRYYDESPGIYLRID